MPGLHTLPPELREAVLAFLNHDDLHAVERTSRTLASTLASSSTWEDLVGRSLILSDVDAPSERQGWRALACMLTRPTESDRTLLTSVVDCSSMDREEESPQNTLKLSPCWHAIRTRSRRASSPLTRALLQLTQMDHQQVAQVECGCYGGAACYWSTSGSEDRKAEDFIDYTVKPGSRVDRVEIIPYCAYWQPSRPTYGPVTVSVAFYNCPSDAPTDSDARTLIYHTPEYPLSNEMKRHECVLPAPVWLPNGAVMRLHMHGRHQNGTFETDSQFFYTTLSFVGAVGFGDAPPT